MNKKNIQLEDELSKQNSIVNKSNFLKLSDDQKNRMEYLIKGNLKYETDLIRIADGVSERLLDEFDLPFEQYELLRLEVLETITQLYSINNPQVRDKLQRIDEFFKLIDENKNNNLINFANNNTSFLFVMFVVLILVGILYYVKRDNKQKKLRDFHPKRFKLR